MYNSMIQQVGKIWFFFHPASALVVVVMVVLLLLPLLLLLLPAGPIHLRICRCMDRLRRLKDGVSLHSCLQAQQVVGQLLDRSLQR